MKNSLHSLFRISVLIPLLNLPVLALAQDLPPVQMGEILETLKELKTKQETSISGRLGEAQREIQSAAGSGAAAVTFYANAYMATKIEGKNRENTEFRDWKKEKEALLDDPAVAEAIQYHLQYLSLTLQRVGGVEVKDLLPQLIDYSRAILVDKDVQDVKGKDAQKLVDSMLRQPVSNSIFIQLYGLRDTVAGLEGWVDKAGDGDEILTTVVLPELREQKDPKVLQYWDDRIKREEQKAMESGLAFRARTFATLEKPELLWKRAKEFKEVGLQNRAVMEMLNVVKAYPSHPKAGGWIAEIEAMVKPAEEVAPAVTPAPSNEAGQSVVEPGV